MVRLTTNKTMTTADRMRTGMVGSGNRHVVGGAGTGMFSDRATRPTRGRSGMTRGGADWLVTGLVVAAAAGLVTAAFRLLGRVRWLRLFRRIGTFYLTSMVVRKAAARSQQGGQGGMRQGGKRTAEQGRAPQAAGTPMHAGWTGPTGTQEHALRGTESSATVPDSGVSLHEAALITARQHPSRATEMEHLGGDIEPVKGGPEKRPTRK